MRYTCRSVIAARIGDSPMTTRQYWWQAIRWPVALALVAGLILAVTNGDLAIANALFFDSAHMRWRGGDSWWTNRFLHTCGGWFVRIVIAATGVLLVTSFRRDSLRHWRRPVGYFLLSTLLTVGIVGLLKQFTNIDCPWDLTPFGGRFPYIHLFADRPDELRAAHCFPAAHASSGYAMMALYFVAIERRRKWARAGLAVGIAIGLIFGLAQQSRGAHFVSHDLCSATIAWCVSLTVYCTAFRGRLWTVVKDGHVASAPAAAQQLST